ncbi:MAG: exodeoxyribonuclease VII small subunit [Micrococcales bacterium]
MATSKENPNADVAELSYEQAREQLIQVVNSLEQGTATLEESMMLWERGEALAAQCEKWLNGAKSRLDAAIAAKTPSKKPTTDE